MGGDDDGEDSEDHSGGDDGDDSGDDGGPDSGDDGGDNSGPGGGEDDGGEEEQDEVEGIVLSVDLDTRIVTLTNCSRLRVADDGLIESDGDFITLAELKSAVDAGLEVQADAEVAPGAGDFFEVTRAKFESDGDGAGN